MDNNSINMRDDSPDKVADLFRQAKFRKEAKRKYQILSQLLASTKEVDITGSTELFLALNRERLDFEQLMNLHPEEIRDTIEQVRIDRKFFTDGKYWNPHSKAKWGCLGHIPACVYHSRPDEYWKDENVLRNFFNTFPVFRIADRKV